MHWFNSIICAFPLVVVPDLHEFIEEAFVNETYFSENTTVSSFKRLFTTELGLQSYYNDDYGYYISPDRGIRGTYVCQARNFFGNRSVSVTINVKGNTVSNIEHLMFFCHSTRRQIFCSLYQR